MISMFRNPFGKMCIRDRGGTVAVHKVGQQLLALAALEGDRTSAHKDLEVAEALDLDAHRCRFRRVTQEMCIRDRGETSTGTLSNGTWNGTVLSTGASGSAVEQVQFWRNTLAQYLSLIHI